MNDLIMLLIALACLVLVFKLVKGCLGIILKVVLILVVLGIAGNYFL